MIFTGCVDTTDTANEAPVKERPKKPKEEHFSIRKYYGDKEDEVFIMDAKCSGNIGRYLNVSRCLKNLKKQDPG